MVSRYCLHSCVWSGLRDIEGGVNSLKHRGNVVKAEKEKWVSLLLPVRLIVYLLWNTVSFHNAVIMFGGAML